MIPVMKINAKWTSYRLKTASEMAEIWNRNTPKQAVVFDDTRFTKEPALILWEDFVKVVNDATTANNQLCEAKQKLDKYHTAVTTILDLLDKEKIEENDRKIIKTILSLI